MTVDPKTLYEMVKEASQGVQRALKIPDQPDQNATFLYAYSGYPAYVRQYNHIFLPQIIELYGDEAKQLLPPIFPDPPVLDGHRMAYRNRLETAAVELNAAVAYLKNKLNITDQQIEALLDLIQVNLRPAIFEDPKNEKEIQNILETIFRARGYDFERERDTVPYSGKFYVPDFTFEALDLALEAKLCNRPERVKELVDEINADIVGYQKRYKLAIFVIYDLGFIRDEQTFRSGIESNLNVYVKIIKK